MRNKPTRRELTLAMAAYAKPSLYKGLAVFLFDFTGFVAAIAGVLLIPALWAKVLCSVVAGLMTANLVTVAHDAAHNSLTPNRRLNWWIGVLAFAPSLFNYRLWAFDHHVLHHPKTNGPHGATYKPMSKATYDALPSYRRAWERFVRSPNPVAFGLYYIVERWLPLHFAPGDFLPAQHKASAWKHTAFLTAYFAGLMTLFIVAPIFAPVTALQGIVLGFVVPFFVFQMLLGATLYIHHTNPRVAWYDDEADWKQNGTPENTSIHLKLPHWLAFQIHYVLEHPAHHVYPAIPCYNLWNAQLHLNTLMGEEAIVESLTLARMLAIIRTCKLYDYQSHCWTDFNGKPLTPSLITKDLAVS